MATLDSRNCAVATTSCSRHAGAHTRRRFYEVAEATSSPIAVEALRRIGELYAIEASIRGQPPKMRLAARRSSSKPIVDALYLWLARPLTQVPGRGVLAEAIRYALARWHWLTRFLHDPSNARSAPVALGRKNHLFAGSDGGRSRWATLCSLIETAKLNEVEPNAYLRDVLQRESLEGPIEHVGRGGVSRPAVGEAGAGGLARPGHASTARCDAPPST